MTEPKRQAHEWPEGPERALRGYVRHGQARGPHWVLSAPASQIAKAINAEFGTTYTAKAVGQKWARLLHREVKSRGVKAFAPASPLTEATSTWDYEP